MKLGVASPEFVCVQVPRNTTEEGQVLQIIGQRLMRGYEQYGDLSKASQERDWTAEAFEELLDGMVYVAKQIIQLRKAAVLADAKRAAEAPVPGAPTDGREVHSVRPGAASGEEDGIGEADTERVPGGGRDAAVDAG